MENLPANAFEYKEIPDSFLAKHKHERLDVLVDFFGGFNDLK